MVERRKVGESETFRLSQQCLADSELWFPAKAHSLVHHTLALCGEAGELANLVKKLDRGDLDIKDASVRHKVMMETTDVYVYNLNIAGLLGLDLERSYEIVRGENMRRFAR